MSPKIVEELKNSLHQINSLPFLFIGSGFSRRYLDLPNWKDLIEEFAKKAHPEGSSFAYQLYKNEINHENKSQDEILPEIASLIEKDFTQKYLTDPIYEERRNANQELIKADISCLKLGLADYFIGQSDKFSGPNFPEEIDALKAINKNVAGIITTNYDTFLESIFDDFTPYIGQHSLLFNQIYEMGEIYKIHGCCTDPKSMVFTNEDYIEYNKRNAYLSAKLLTIFLEHPIIFIGYSLNDQNIKLILNDIVQCLTDDQLQQLSKRMFFVLRASDSRPERVTTVKKEFSGRPFEVTEIVRNDFADIYRTIGLSAPKFVPKVLRALKKNIYELVTSNDPTGRLHVLSIDDTENIDKVDFVMGVGAMQQIGEEGYAGLTPINIFEDLLYNKDKYDNKKIVYKTLPTLLKTHANSIPVFKYVTDFDGTLPERVCHYIENNSTLDSHLNKTIRSKPPLNKHSVNEVKSAYDISDADGAKKCLEDIVRLKQDELNENDLLQLLIEIYESIPGLLTQTEHTYLKSLFRKVAKIYDWLRYCQDKK